MYLYVAVSVLQIRIYTSTHIYNIILCSGFCIWMSMHGMVAERRARQGGPRDQPLPRGAKLFARFSGRSCAHILFLRARTSHVGWARAGGKQAREIIGRSLWREPADRSTPPGSQPPHVTGPFGSRYRLLGIFYLGTRH
jgi:hypothetical protein